MNARLHTNVVILGIELSLFVLRARTFKPLACDHRPLFEELVGYRLKIVNEYIYPILISQLKYHP